MKPGPNSKAMVKEPTLLFCVGAAKAGTSWLYKYFLSHPDLYLRSVKELHYFNAIDGNTNAGQINDLQDHILNKQEKSYGASNTKRERLQDQIDDCRDLISLHEGSGEDVSGYLNYLTTGRQKESVIADFTPAYGLLAPQRLAKMSNIASVTRFIYILRDPVSRLWSHIRMKAGRKFSDDAEFTRCVNSTFWSFGRGKQRDIWARSDYKQTLENFACSVDPRQLMVVFYEELFSSATLDRICDFLGVRSFPAPNTLPVFASPIKAMRAGQLEHAQQWLAPQYEYVHARFGELPKAWQVNMPGVKI